MVMVWYGGMFISCHEDSFLLLGQRRLVADEFNEPQHYGTIWYGMVPDHTIGECKRSASHAPNVVHTIYTAKLKVKPPLMQPFPDDIGIILAFR